jgi:hypothetical protein
MKIEKKQGQGKLLLSLVYSVLKYFLPDVDMDVSSSASSIVDNSFFNPLAPHIGWHQCLNLFCQL